MTVLMGWNDESHVDIAAMMAEQQVADYGTVMFALFGSASNLTSRRSSDDKASEVASDVAGFYEILKRSSEEGDPSLDEEYVLDESDFDAATRVDAVTRILGRRFEQSESIQGEVLFQVFYQCENYEWGARRYRRALIGTPIWVQRSS